MIFVRVPKPESVMADTEGGLPHKSTSLTLFQQLTKAGYLSLLPGNTTAQCTSPYEGMSKQ